MPESITFEDRIAEQLRLYAAPAARPPRREAVANAVEAARNVHGVQRRSWWPAWRSNSLNTYVKLIAAAAVLVVAVAGYQFLPTQSGGSGGQPPIAPSPSPSAAQTAGVALPIFPSFSGNPKPVAAGTYALGPSFPVSTSFVVPAGWLSCVNNAGLLCSADGVGEVNIFIVTNVVADPCEPTTLRDPAVGPTVDDLVTAISSLPWSAVTPPTDITVDGFRGKEFEVTTPTWPACWGTDHPGWWETVHSGSAIGEAPGERIQLRILDVQGTRVVIAGSYLPGTTSAQDLAHINAIMDSVRFGP